MLVSSESVTRGYMAQNAPLMQSTQMAFAAAPTVVADGAVLNDSVALGRVQGGDATQANPEQPDDGVQRVILRNATLQIVVEDTEATIGEISGLAEGMGGWVVTANTNTVQRNGIPYTDGNITVRVPAEQLDSVIETIRAGAFEVTSQNVTGQDVTEEYVDLSSRLGNLKATEEQLQLIMDDAFTVADVLAVQTELTRVRGDIEVIEGRLRYFDQAAAFSSVTVTIRQRVESIGVVEVEGWNPLRTAADAFGNLVVLGQNFVDGVIVLLIIGVPFAIALVLAVWVLRVLWRRLRPRRVVQAAPSEVTTG
jgi:hypothetical protein